MSNLSFALLSAHTDGATIDQLAETLSLPSEFVTERIEAARLCILVCKQTADLHRGL